MRSEEENPTKCFNIQQRQLFTEGLCGADYRRCSEQEFQSAFR